MKLFKYLLCISLVILITGCKGEIFSLDSKYYEKSSIEEINTNTLEQLIDDKESFAVFVYQPLCENSNNLENIINELIDTYQISFYKIKFTDIKNTNLGKKVKYYPSFVIYKDGKVIDYLESDKDADINKFKNLEDFKNWLSSYVKLGEVNTNNKETEKEEVIEEIKLDYLTYDENKVNIYMFWGDGCPHCENAMKFLNSIEKEYGEYYKLNKFEVWYNPDNSKLLYQFANKMGEEVSRIPYIIIGNKTFKGFREEYKQQIIDAIVSQHENSFDVYFNN